jgi:exodeoxyribonuclease VII small subunit
MAKKRPETKPNTAPPSFEESLQRLEAVVRELEQGDLNLSDALQRYEQGVAALRACHQSLQAAETKIELLFRIDEDGNLQTEPFDEQQMSLEQKQSSRSQRRSRNDLDTPGLFPTDD